MAFDTIAVDLGGVAARFVPERRVSALAAATGLPPDEITDRLFGQGLDARLERGEVDSVDDALDLLLAALDRRVDAETLVRLWSEAFEPDAQALSILRSRAETVVLFTNNGPIVEACLEGPLRTIRDVCDVVMCSWRLHALKPEAEAFERCAKALAKAPDQLFLVDDSPANVAGARHAGWQAKVVTNAADLSHALADAQ